MKRLIVASVFAALASAAFAGLLDKAWIKGVTDADPLAYKPGQPMTFTLTPMDLDGEIPANTWFLSWKRSGDDGVIKEGRVPLTKEPFVYTTALDRAGFVRLEAYVVDAKGVRYQKKFLGDRNAPGGQKAFNDFERAKKAVFFDGGAGVDIATLRSHPEPKDFDAFWAAQYKRLDLVPLKAERVEIPCANAKARLFAVRIDCAGLRPVTGYLSVPEAVIDEGKTFPARLQTHGYNGDRFNHDRPAGAVDNEIVLNINAHGLKLPEFGGTEADRKALRWECRSHDRTYAFDPAQNADPEVAYFNGMVLRVKRALQYLKTVKGWNGKDLWASGGSQGGLQTIWAAGCGEGVTGAFSGITWCCDMYTTGKLRLERANNLASDGWYIPWTEAMGYFDAANFARRIPTTCHTEITRAGLGDYCCPPTGIAKMWNNIPGANKKIFWVQGSEHGYVPPDYAGRDFVRTGADR